MYLDLKKLFPTFLGEEIKKLCENLVKTSVLNKQNFLITKGARKVANISVQRSAKFTIK